MDQLDLIKPKRPKKPPREWKLVALRDCPMPMGMQACDTPEIAATYWRKHVVSAPYFNPECECLVVLHLNTRHHIKGHHLVSIGTLNTLLVHAREVFRVAILAASHAIVIMHNHPSGDPTPSEGDIKVTRDLMRAGRLLKIDVLDHVILGFNQQVSLRTLGYCSD